MAQHTMAVELFDEDARYRRPSREERQARRARREWWARVTLVAGSGLGLLAMATFALFAMFSDSDPVAAQTNDPVGIQAVAPAPPPIPPVVPDPQPITATTLPEWEPWPVTLPGGRTTGWLITDGRPHDDGRGGTIHAARLQPGLHTAGQAIVSVPVDAAGLNVTQSFNTGGRSWWVIERRTVDATDPATMARLLEANPIVPTVMLLSSLPTNPRPLVVAR